MKIIACECGKKVKVGDQCVTVKCSICVINEHTVEENRINVNQLVGAEK